MKKLNSLKLNQLSKVDLEEREMDMLRGGECGVCACGCGSAPTDVNGKANAAHGYTSTGGWDGENDMCYCTGSTREESNSCSGGSTANGRPL